MNYWDEFDRLQRGEMLTELVSYGCSARGLAEVLPCSATTIMRYIDLADLASYLCRNMEPISASPIGFIPAPSLRELLAEVRRAWHSGRQRDFSERVREAHEKERQSE